MGLKMAETLYEYLSNGFGKKEDLNCAEKMLYGANEVYKLGISKEDLKLAGGFGGGMGVGIACGAISGSVMALSKAFIKKIAHEDTLIKTIEKEFIEKFQKTFGELNCAPLVEKYRKPDTGCDEIIFETAKILDEIMNKYCKK